METAKTRRKKCFGDTTTGMKSILKRARITGFRPFCPVTCNLPTRMTEDVFQRMFGVNRDKENKNYCNQVCRGKLLPDGLAFVKPIIFNNLENDMGKWNTGINTGHRRHLELLNCTR